MKILITTDPEIPVPPILYGGAERLASDLIDAYTDKNHQVFLIANRESKHSRVEAFYPWKSSSSVGYKNIVKNALQLRKVYKQVKPDIVHCFSRLLYIYPLLFTSNALFVKRYGRFISPKSIKLAKCLAGERLQLVAAASHMLNHLPKKSQWKVIYNFVDTDFYCDSNCEKSGLFFLGRIEDIKGVNEAIQIANKLGELLIIAGNIEPEHQKYFEEKVKPFLNDKITYIGSIDNKRKKEIFQSVKATLFPIKWEEPFGIVMAESMACGTPVIGFRRGSVPEVVKNNESGFVVESVSEMIEAVKKIDKIDRNNVRKYAEKMFSRDNAAQQYLDLFEKLIEKNNEK
jgi:glycosyltransferase involved in cell wall biosynthesis